MFSEFSLPAHRSNHDIDDTVFGKINFVDGKHPLLKLLI